MSIEKKYLAKIEEVTSPKSQYMGEMKQWLERIFPEYCPARFDKLLSKHQHSNGQHQIQIFISLVDNMVVGLAQQLYQEWQGGLLADIDLLGVLKPFRRSGFATALVQKCLRSIAEIARQYEILPIGVITLVDPIYAPIVQLHQKQGGQIRTDYQYSSGDIIVWYPMQAKYNDLATSTLGEQLQRFGGLLEC